MHPVGLQSGQEISLAFQPLIFLNPQGFPKQNNTTMVKGGRLEMLQ
jgi:hypothetical protein